MAVAKLPPNMTELSSYVDKDLKLRFKLACTAKQKTMSEVITDLIEEWLEQNEAPPPGKTSNQGKGDSSDGS
ncbi:plasmid partition protein ParG [Microseira sp. BLCC-F43]|uniref:plasmid partition protein ParG n=1 Tax=Microseira sp. BLCC-F43 TaxID=3153602 RepID=UPI0035B7144D